MDFNKLETSFTKLKKQMDQLSTWPTSRIHALDIDYLKKLTQEFYGELIHIDVDSVKPAQTVTPSIHTSTNVTPAPRKPEIQEAPKVVVKSIPVPKKHSSPHVTAAPEPEKIQPTAVEAKQSPTEPDTPSPAQKVELVANDQVEVMNPTYSELFDLPSGSDLSTFLRNRKIEHIGKAMGFNEKIFTVNELFNGDQARFDQTINKLNDMTSFDDAKTYLIRHVVEDLKWSSDQKVKKARTFIQHISRKYQTIEA